MEMIGEAELKRVKEGEIIQLQRKGFFRCDVPYAEVSAYSSREQPIILFHIPDGHATSTAPPVLQDSKTGAKESKRETKVDASADNLNEQIIAQGNKVRDLKAAKADKATVDAEVKSLLSLKAEYKAAAGKDWKPNSTSEVKQETKVDASADNLNEQIIAQGNKVRDLKAAKADKATVDAEVKSLLSLKAEYKAAAGKDWKPNSTSEVKQETKVDASADNLNEQIIAQGNKVRDLKAAKADKATVDAEVKSLLSLKAEYKAAAGKDWKPNSTSEVKNPIMLVKDVESIASLNDAIVAQGNRVRELKTAKADKASIDCEVKDLLSLKAKYKSITGQDWKPNGAPQHQKTVNPISLSEDDPVGIINEKIIAQGNKVRDLKSAKANKAAIDAEVKTLLSLKEEYKRVAGLDWKPKSSSPAAAGSSMKDDDIALAHEIKEQSDVVGNLKASKPDSITITKEVAKLVELKLKFKAQTGKDWTPSVLLNAKPKQSKCENSSRIAEQGNKVRDLKAARAGKETIQQEVQKLLSLKAEYKEIFGKDYVPTGINDSAAREPKAKANKSEDTKAKGQVKRVDGKNEVSLSSKESESGKTGTRLGLEAKKADNLSDWYSQVITKGEMIEYYDVSGCYILRPWSFAIWDIIKDFLDKEIKKLGVQNCYFPMFVSKAALEKEKAHIADFAPEVAWVTKSGNSDLAEHIAIRPTSETVMYPAYAKWLKSHRDLPLKLNQWNNVVRWEFKHPQPFLRTREFLWQEGHTAFANKAEADEEVLKILDLYAQIYEYYLAVPVVKGRKTEKEKFAGGDYTTTVEAFISSSGRAIQGATSHYLGQNFSKMFDIQVEGTAEGGEKTFIYQNSWGITTRTIGVMIMVHGDDKGLVLPPRVASIQAVIVPCGITASTTQEQKERLLRECDKLEEELKRSGKLRVKGDYRDNYSPGWKFNHWELKGVPVRVELGPKDLEKGQVTFVRRDSSNRIVASRSNAYDFLLDLLDEIQSNLFVKAKADLTEHIKRTNEWKEFCSHLDGKNLILAPFCGRIECEDKIKADSVREDTNDDAGAPSMGAKGLCIPFDQPEGSVEQLKGLKCIHNSCQEKPKFYTLFGRSY
ncbi:PREDICTED: bifunctional glutamate/proline--tRNA ligase [Ceratosolen solmsi marchali]|uniref:Bifunctional glutamate/proline--tRNA ligase n=1 Tax=Ceratosolen solmsi marchali TaxID=326594 RepID=A0AAJ7DW56_9HYME|nr:PREDICTED: bifunctional glutamate/proline--tRNA ligase [Ceratosolen solmsi marchali]